MSTAPTPIELATIAAALDKTGTGDLPTLAMRALALYWQCALTIEQARPKPCPAPPPMREPAEPRPSKFPVPFGEFLKMALPKSSVPDRETAYRDWIRTSVQAGRAEKKCDRLAAESKPCNAHAIHAAEPLPGMVDEEVIAAIDARRRQGFGEDHYSLTLNLFKNWLAQRNQTEKKEQSSSAAKSRWSQARIAAGNQMRFRKALDIPASD